MTSRDYILLIFIVLTILLLFFWYHYCSISKICNSKESLDKFIFHGKKSSLFPTILIVGGTHGNEPAGSNAIQELINKLTTNEKILNHGKLILVPKVNNCGILTNSRFIPLVWDLNRKYPKKLNKEGYNPNSNKNVNDVICSLVDESDLILDFHEGWSYRSKNKSSVGSTLTPTNRSVPTNLSIKVVELLNKDITDKQKKFMIMTDDINMVNNNPIMFAKNEEIKGTLRYFCSLLNKDYILVETTGQNDIQPMHTRLEQCRIIMDTIFKQFGMI